jgi:hypothetical protein
MNYAKGKLMPRVAIYSVMPVWKIEQMLKGAVASSVFLITVRSAKSRPFNFTLYVQ